MRSRRALVAAMALAVVSCAAAPARADGAADVAAARELFNEASRFAADGKWDEARVRYQRSLSLKRASITMYSLGVAQRNTGRLVEAIENFRAFLAEPVTRATRAYIAPAQQAVAEISPRLARVKIAIDPADAPGIAVTIDGERVPNAVLDRPRVVSPGAHEVKATGQGYGAAAQRVQVGDGESAAVSLHLVREPAAPAIAPAPLGPRAEAAPAAPMAPRPRSPVPWALVVGGGGAFVGGVVVGMLGVAQAGSARTRDGADAHAARTKAAVGDVIAGAGLAAAATGVVLLITRRAPTEHSTAAALR